MDTSHLPTDLSKKTLYNVKQVDILKTCLAMKNHRDIYDSNQKISYNKLFKFSASMGFNFAKDVPHLKRILKDNAELLGLVDKPIENNITEEDANQSEND